MDEVEKTTTEETAVSQPAHTADPKEDHRTDATEEKTTTTTTETTEETSDGAS